MVSVQSFGDYSRNGGIEIGQILCITNRLKLGQSQSLYTSFTINYSCVAAWWLARVQHVMKPGRMTGSADSADLCENRKFQGESFGRSCGCVLPLPGALREAVDCDDYSKLLQVTTGYCWSLHVTAGDHMSLLFIACRWSKFLSLHNSGNFKVVWPLITTE